MLNIKIGVCVTSREKITNKSSEIKKKLRCISVIRSNLQWVGISDVCEGEVGDKAGKVDRDQSQRSF